MMGIRIIVWVARVAGVGALLLGLSFWIAQIDLISIHMLLGIALALSMIVLGVIMLFMRGMRILGASAIIYALILPVFGLTQSRLLIGDLHWLIQTAHLLVGIGALALVQWIYTRYLRLRQETAKNTGTRATISIK